MTSLTKYSDLIFSDLKLTYLISCNSLMCSTLTYPPSSVSVLIWSGCRWVTHPSSALSRLSVLIKSQCRRCPDQFLF
uniref:Uncharacterized protein n=1 Tax=Anguilla anguilla TaxID=7936 RepID=A0A0E9RIF6_ANGAN